MTSGPNMGSINMPKLLRTLKYRTNNVRKFLFHRDAIFEKDVGTVKDANADGSGRTDALAGPAVSFGYETGDNTTRVAGTDRAYHVQVDEMNLYGLEGLIVPTSATTSSLGRTGNTHSGSCDIYIPTLNQLVTKVPENVPANDDNDMMGGSEFTDTIYNSWLDAIGNTYFDRFEGGDELVDMERIVHNPANQYNVDESPFTCGLTYDEGDTTVRSHRFADGINRLQFKIKHSESGSFSRLYYVTISGTDSQPNTVSLKWTFSAQGIKIPGAAASHQNETLVIDLPLIHANGKNIKTGDTYVFSYAGGPTSITATATVVTGAGWNTNEFELNKLCGDANFDNTNELNSFTLGFYNDNPIDAKYDVRDIVFYEATNWVITGITEYRDEYIKLSCNKYRGSSPSRRRAHG